MNVFAYKMPVGSFDALSEQNKSRMPLDPSFDFNGIVKLSNCSGSVIKFSGMPTSAKAIAMTNGHCLREWGGMIDPGTSVVDKPVTRQMKVYSRDQKLIPITADRIIYATMTGTDITLYQLTDTYADLEKKRVDAFDLDTNHPTLNLDIEIISGYWDRGYRCKIDAFIYQLKEEGWTMNDSIRYSKVGCNTIGGTSGSPIIHLGTHAVVGINNTGNESGEKCTMNNPCEVSKSGVITVVSHASYGQQTYQIYSCLTPDFKINLNSPACSLNKLTK